MENNKITRLQFDLVKEEVKLENAKESARNMRRAGWTVGILLTVIWFFVAVAEVGWLAVTIAAFGIVPTAIGVPITSMAMKSAIKEQEGKVRLAQHKVDQALIDGF